MIETWSAVVAYLVSGIHQRILPLGGYVGKLREPMVARRSNVRSATRAKQGEVEPCTVV